MKFSYFDSTDVSEMDCIREFILKGDDVYSGKVTLRLSSDNILTVLDSKQIVIVKFFCSEYNDFETIMLLNDVCGVISKIRYAWQGLSKQRISENIVKHLTVDSVHLFASH